MVSIAPDGRAPCVLHLISSLKVGGSERLLVSTMVAARGNPDMRFVVVVMNEAVDAGLMAELQASGWPVYHLARPEGHLHPRYLMQVLKIMRRHDVQVVHAHNTGSLAWGMLAKLLRPGLKLVYTQHEHGGADRIRGLNRSLYRTLVDMTVAISPYIAAETRALSGQRVKLVENGVDIAKFSRAQPYREPSRPVRIVQVGRIVRIKGQDILIDAVRTCLDQGFDIECTLVGAPSDPVFMQHLNEQIHRLGLAGRVRFELGRTDIDAIFETQDMFILSSREEGFGLSIVEAMAASLPVIVAAVGGAKDIVCDGENGLLFPACDAQQLARRIAELIATPELGRKLATAGYVTARRFDIQRTLMTQIELYRTLLPESAGPPASRSSYGAHGVEARAFREMP